MGQLYPDINAENISEAIGHANTVSSGALGIGVPISLFVIVFIVGLIFRAKASITFTVGSVLFFLSSSLLAWGQYINPVFAIIGAILTGLGVMWVKIENKG